MCNTQNLLVQFPRSNVTDRFRDYFDLHFISSVKVSTQYLTPWGMFRNHASPSVRPIDATLSRTCQERLREDCRLQKSWDNCVCVVRFGDLKWRREMRRGWWWWAEDGEWWQHRHGPPGLSSRDMVKVKTTLHWAVSCASLLPIQFQSMVEGEGIN